MAKIIILNGPAGVGKDTIGGELAAYYDCSLVSFKRPMFGIAASLLGVKAFNEFMEAYNDREQKEMPQSFLDGRTCREFMIWISESVVKPLFGNHHFGKLMSEHVRLYDEGSCFVCTDGGFPDEVIQLLEDGHDVTLVRLFMDGKTFAGDSRNYIRIEKSKLPHYSWYEECDVHLVNGDIYGGVMAVAEAGNIRPCIEEWDGKLPLVNSTNC